MNSIIDRLEKATGGDRELDAAIFDIACGGLFWPENETLWVQVGWNRVPKAFTASLDAAIALVEKMLPGWGWMVERQPNGEAEAWLDEFGAYAYGRPVQGRTPAIALLIALFRALRGSQ